MARLRLRVAGLANAATLALLAAWLFLVPPAVAQPTSAQLRSDGQQCLRANNTRCAERAFTAYIALRPTDPTGYALRGIALTRAEQYTRAIADLEKAMDLGEGTWDIFAAYAEALRHTDKVPEAIDWSYRTLDVVPRLVDVRGNLATMLVVEGRHHEALAVLAGFDASLVAKGRTPYFAAQRLAIETALERRGATRAAASALRLPKLESFFYAPVALGPGRFSGFIADTGASTMVVPRALLAESKAPHRITRAGMRAKLADGSSATGDLAVIAQVTIGAYTVADVPVFLCDGCAALLGQEMLSRFDLKSSRVQGVEFMTLTPRTPLVR